MYRFTERFFIFLCFPFFISQKLQLEQVRAIWPDGPGGAETAGALAARMWTRHEGICSMQAFLRSHSRPATAQKESA